MLQLCIGEGEWARRLHSGSLNKLSSSSGGCAGRVEVAAQEERWRWSSDQAQQVTRGQHGTHPNSCGTETRLD